MDSTEVQNRKIFDAAYVDVFISGFNTLMNYPYIMRDVNHPSPKMARKSDVYILDSAISDDDVDNHSVREVAEHVDADVVVPKDFIGQPERAIESAGEMMENTNREVIVPVQNDGYGYHHWASKAYEQFGSRPWAYAVGGVKDMSAKRQIDAAKDVRRGVGDNARVHMFGGGMSPTWIREIRNNKNIIDTLDMSTPVQAAMTGQVVHSNMTHIPTGNVRGTHSTIRSARLAEISVLNFCYMISDLPRESDVEEILE